MSELMRCNVDSTCVFGGSGDSETSAGGDLDGGAAGFSGAVTGFTCVFFFGI
jgi:hypothetical protein